MENQLSVIVKQSGLETSEGQSLLEKFGNYEQIAKEWETKAKAIVVTDASQTTEMAMAKAARKKFSDLRIAVERSRKELKEQSLRKGQAIDAIARFLVSLISPIEEHLKQQEDFIKIEAAKKAEEEIIALEKRAEEELRLKEEADRKERERIRLENIKLQKEAEEREKKMEAEREKARKEKEESEAKLKAEREAHEKAQEAIRAKAEAERLKAEEITRKEREKAEAERVRIVELARIEKEKAEKERLEKERIQKLLDEQIECPFCHKKFNK